MEQGKGTKSSSSSTTFAELFRPKVSPSSPSTILDSIFPPKPKVPGGEFQLAKSQGSPSAKPGDSGYTLEGQEVDSIYPQQWSQPCNLSSSIYYGGQDICPPPQPKKDSVYKNEEDDGYATRGNWWQGIIIWISLLLSVFWPINMLIKVHRATQTQFNPFLPVHGK
ncbi:hypothetical protein V6N13_005954 [Hibiscus sabdariffa]|uniref:Uncharacterized protein n=1 Tax=Hibiscus sabdariffa TaxID=183260 RepID=A0ABR2EP85_9ROSI